MIRLCSGMLLLVLAAGAGAQAPLIQEIVFEGNEVTQPKVMLREMVVTVGAPADPGPVERSRQGVQDLGLFRWVEARLEPVPGGVRLVISVKEKHYVLPLPRADASSDGGYGYGAQLRWNNVWGLNHTFYPYFERRQPSEGDADPEKRGIQTRTQLRYSAPFVFDTPYSLGVATGYFETPYLEPDIYDEVSAFVSVGLGRKLSPGPGSQGWGAGGGVTWRDQRLSGPGAALRTEEGRAWSLFAGLGYRDLHFNIYSDDGVTYGASLESASRELGSDYQFTTWTANAAWYQPVGDTPHQTVHVIASAGARHGGPAVAQEAFSLGGAASLRGFEPESAEGDFFYLASVEYLRPVIRNSIRLLAVVDAGNAYAAPDDATLDRVLVSAGFGVRVRFQAFVNLDLELGIAWPLNGGGPRVFASKV